MARSISNHSENCNHINNLNYVYKNIHYSSIKMSSNLNLDELNRVLNTNESNNSELIVYNKMKESYSDLDKIQELSSYKESFP